MPKITRDQGQVKIKRLPVERPTPEMVCEYCSHWSSAKRSGYQDENYDLTIKDGNKRRGTTGTRRCNESGREVGLQTAACGDFVLHNIFWCHRNDQVYDVQVCLARQKKISNSLFENCIGCKQGDLLWEYSKRQRKIERGI